MRALTIKQPCAHLIITPQAELARECVTFPPVKKRVENRKRFTKYRGMILVHAGIDTEYIRPARREDFPEYAWGAIIGTVDIVDCVPCERVGGRPHVTEFIHRRYPWLQHHPHAHGPWCYILENDVRLPETVPCRGQQGWWRPPADVLDRLREMGVAC